MILDELDLKIIRIFCRLDGGETTTWRIMKKIFRNGRDKEHLAVKRRLNKLSNHGIFFFEKSPPQYTLIKDFAVLKKFSFPDRRTKGLALKFENKWHIIEI